MLLPMRVLILGATGMLGHKVWEQFRDRFDCRATVRKRPTIDLFADDRVIEGFEATDFASIPRLVATVRPNVVINCIGVIKQLEAAHDPIASITLNSLFPHVVARAAAEAGSRMIHVSTDCVFAGTRGGYREEDLPDATDLYGRSKLLGEVGAPMLTLRTSVVGRELQTSVGLVEWFLSHRGGTVRGFRNARFSGVTTARLATILAEVTERHPSLTGVYHVSGEAISKYDLLTMLNEWMRADVMIQPDDAMVVDRTLNAERFERATDIRRWPWPKMLSELAAHSAEDEQRRAS